MSESKPRSTRFSATFLQTPKSQMRPSNTTGPDGNLLPVCRADGSTLSFVVIAFCRFDIVDRDMNRLANKFLAQSFFAFDLQSGQTRVRRSDISAISANFLRGEEGKRTWAVEPSSAVSFALAVRQI